MTYARLTPSRVARRVAAEAGRAAHARRQLAVDRRFVFRGDLVFDVGANVGERTASFVKIGARVVAVEPQPGLAEVLRERFPQAEVTIEQVALGAEAGSASMAICSAAPTISTLNPAAWRRGRFSDYSFDRVEQVTVRTLDELIAEHGAPAYCKIDVEGFEHEVLRGLSSPIRVVSFEWTAEVLELAEEAVALLKALDPGVEFNLSVGGAPALALGKWGGADAVLRHARGAGPEGWGTSTPERGHSRPRRTVRATCARRAAWAARRRAAPGRGRSVAAASRSAASTRQIRS